jgi:RNA polymerase sigma-70 factor (ECF subfamily)
VFQESARPLWRVLFAYTGGRRDLADDAVAEAFARAIEHDGQIREPVPWLYRTAFRAANAEMRVRGREPEDAHDGAAPDEAPGDLRRLVGVLRRLSPAERAAVVLHYEVDLPVADVARRMGTSAAAVRVHLHRGRRRLRSLLGEEEVRALGCDGHAALERRAVAREAHGQPHYPGEPVREALDEPRADVLHHQHGDREAGR